MSMPTFLPALIAALAATCVSIAAAETTVIYVNASATGENDGSSWEDAFDDLQDALAVARSGAQIWVAAGTYTPGPPDSGPLSFHLVSGVAMYGGFAGGENVLDQRDWVQNETILSGVTDGTDWSNVLRGERLATAAVIDGFTVKNGVAADLQGGGMRVEDSVVHIANCTFTLNWAGLGGALYAKNSTVTVAESYFLSNNAAQHGGAIYVDGGAVTLTDCDFEGNNSAEQGGAIRTSNSFDSVVVANRCSFSENDGGDDGGVIFALGDIALEQCIFIQNKATFYPTAFEAHGNVLVRECVIDGNIGDGAALFGSGNWTIVDSVVKNNDGGLYMVSAGDVTIAGCEFIGNHSSLGAAGGADISGNGTVVITDTLFQGNSGAWQGGALFLGTSGPVTISSSVISGNSAEHFGGGIMKAGSGELHIVDSVIQNNAANIGLGGAITVQGGSLLLASSTVKSNFSGILANNNTTITIIDSIITENHFEGVMVGYGNAAQGTIINSLITGNIGDGVRVGYVANAPSAVEFIHSTIANNLASLPGMNAGVFVEVGHADIRNSIVWGNSLGSCDGICGSYYGCFCDEMCCIFQDCCADKVDVCGGCDFQHDDVTLENVQIIGSANASHSIVQGLNTYDGPGNIGDDPLFIGRHSLPGEEANFRLQPGSPAIDSGNSDYVPDGIVTDLDGNPRIVDGSGDGEATVDMGPYEFQPDTPSKPGDLNGDGVVDQQDLLVLLAAWGPCADCPPLPGTCPADLNGDCAVGVADLLILLANWG